MSWGDVEKFNFLNDDKIKARPADADVKMNFLLFIACLTFLDSLRLNKFAF